MRSVPCTPDEQAAIAFLCALLLLSMPLWWACLACRWLGENVSAFLGRAAARAD
jgi:hypothetical protein